MIQLQSESFATKHAALNQEEEKDVNVGLFLSQHKDLTINLFPVKKSPFSFYLQPQSFH